MNENIYKAKLEENNVRATKVRIQILEYFYNSETAYSHTEIEKSLSELCDRVTIWRNLQTLEEKNILHSFKDSEGTTRFALCDHSLCKQKHQDNHLHFECKICKEHSCINDIEAKIPSLPLGYQLEELNLHATGICPKCK
jgi:Fur family ferric uptake transcriptional regulator